MSDKVRCPKRFDIQRILDNLMDSKPLTKKQKRVLKHIQCCEKCEKEMREVVSTIGALREMFSYRDKEKGERLWGD